MNLFERYLKKNNRTFSKSSKLFALLILSTIIVHVSGWALNYKMGSFLEVSRDADRFYNMLYPATDGGYFEHFQYILLLWCSLLSFIWLFTRRYFEALSIPLIYLYLFIDDSLRLHDQLIGDFLEKFIVNYQFFEQDIFRSKDIAEWTYWLFILIVALIISIPGFKSSSFEVRQFLKNNYILFLVLSFFGAFIDLLSANINKWLSPFFQSQILVEIFTLIEELGEILTIAFMCIWLFKIVLDNKSSNKQINLKIHD